MSVKVNRLWVRVSAVAVVWATMAFLWNSGLIKDGPVLCWFRLLTGHPCPFCGSTRAIGALCSGDISSAWSLNPLGTLTFIGVVIIVLAPEHAKTLRRRARSALPDLNRWVVVSSVSALFLATWAWNITTRW